VIVGIRYREANPLNIGLSSRMKLRECYAMPKEIASATDEIVVMSFGQRGKEGE